MIKFKDFVTTYVAKLVSQSKEYGIVEPLEVYSEDLGAFMFAIEWHYGNINDLEKIVSKELFESYVEKIWLNQESGRIGITLTKTELRDK